VDDALLSIAQFALMSSNDLRLAMYRTFCKRFEQKINLHSDDHRKAFLVSSITQDDAKGTVTMIQEHYLMACLEKFCLADCNGVHNNEKPARLTFQNRPEVKYSIAQELYRGVVGSLLYLALWTLPDIALAESELYQFFSNSGKSHLEAAKQVFYYLKKTISLGPLGLVYCLSPSTTLPNTFFGHHGTLTLIGQAVLTLVSQRLGLYSCSMVLLFSGAQT
jgi:hypothetical protein